MIRSVNFDVFHRKIVLFNDNAFDFLDFVDRLFHGRSSM